MFVFQRENDHIKGAFIIKMKITLSLNLKNLMEHLIGQQKQSTTSNPFWKCSDPQKFGMILCGIFANAAVPPSFIFSLYHSRYDKDSWKCKLTSAK